MDSKEKSFGAELPIDLIEAFTSLIEDRGFLKKKAVEGSLRLFLALPFSAQAMVVSGGAGAGEELRDVLRELVQDVIDQGFEAGSKLRPRNAPSK